MSAGYYYSLRVDCPHCMAPVPSELYGDLLAHVKASGVRVRFGCLRCGKDLEIVPEKKPAPPVSKTP